MRDDQCHHIMGSGKPCGSPRMNDKNYCYYHTRLHESFLLPGNRYYEPPPLTDAHNIQLALHHVYRAQAKGLITYKQANSLLYNIQLAKNNLRTLETPPPDEIITTDLSPSTVILNEDACPSEGPRDRQTNDERSKISDHFDSSGAPSSPSFGESGIQNDCAPTEPSGDSFTEIEYDPANPPLCHEPALRPFIAPKPPANSPAVWIPLSDEELQKISDHHCRRPDDYLWQQYQRRMRLAQYFSKNPNPTPDQIADAIANMERSEAEEIREREEAVRKHRALQRDEQNKKLLGVS